MITLTRIGFVEGQNVSPEYATMTPHSHENKHLLLQQSGGWVRLYDQNGAYLRTLPSAVNASSRPRWSRTNPDVLTFLGGNSIFKFDVVAGITLIRTFTEYIATTSDGRNGIDDNGEAELSQDGNHRVLAGKKKDGTVDVFLYSLATNVKGPVTPLPPDTDGLKLSADNRIIMSRPSGITVFVGPSWKQIYPYNSHACPCIYKGSPSLAIVGDKNVIIVDLNSAKQTIVPFVVDSSFVVAHVSACDKPFLIVSTSAPKSNAPSQIVRISLEDLTAEVLCNTGTVYRDYESQPKASVSRDGSRVVFSVDDGKQISTWMLKLAAAQPVPVPQPQPVRYTWDKYKATIDKDGITILAA